MRIFGGLRRGGGKNLVVVIGEKKGREKKGLENT